MAANKHQTLPYENIRLEGGLFVPDLLERAGQGRCDHQAPADYHIPKGIQLHDEYGRSFKIARAEWKDFVSNTERSDLTRAACDQRTRAYVIKLLHDAFGYDISEHPGIEIDAHRYPITFFGAGGRVPVVVAPSSLDLMSSDEAFAVIGGGARRKSPVQLMQEFLNASKDHTWGIITNGRHLRLLRDSATLTRPCYLEIDLETILKDEVYHEFRVAWLLLHASRALPVKDAECAWEVWRESGHKEGARVREGLRKGVTDALLALGEGFLQHPTNESLRHSLDNGSLSREAYFEQLLRLVYRFIFLFTTEERGILHPEDDSSEGDAARTLYAEGYALRRLSQRALRCHGFDDYHDLWQGIQIVLRCLQNGESRLALPSLGGLFAEDQCPDFVSCRLTNRVVLTVMRHLRWAEIDGALSRVDYRNMGPEELGSVYESLLELVPEVDVTTRTFAFVGLEDEASTAGNKRKTTGSYYTPDSLVKELIKSALDPVIEACLTQHADAPEKALLSLAVIDPACGSGHFLLSAARRLAERLAPLRSTDGSVRDEDYRTALRDVISHCIYGVDRNPLALELARSALWLEGFEPGRPLSFLDHHLVCGDALLGILNFDQLRKGIPKDAYQMLSGDDRKACSDLARINNAQIKTLEAALKGQQEIFNQEEREDIFKKMAELDAMPDNTPSDRARKEQVYTEFLSAARNSHPAHAADLFVGAFLVPKDNESSISTVPTTNHLQYELTGNGTAATPEMRRSVSDVCTRAKVLHWPLVFAHVFARGGFDCVLGNPPWERIKIQEQEFFASSVPAVAVAKNKAERAKRIAWLSEGLLAMNLHPDAHPEKTVSEAEIREYRAFIIEKRISEAISVFAHLAGMEGGRYPLTGTGDVNTYALFAETMTRLIAGKGRAGFIVPTGIATDDSTKQFFVSLIENEQLVSLVSFYEVRLWFKATDERKPFCLLTIGSSKYPKFIFDAYAIDDLQKEQKWFSLSQEDFMVLNPNTRTCPTFRSKMDAEITRKIYRNVPVLILDAMGNCLGENSWGIHFSAMFHMSNDSHLFVDADSVSSGKLKSLPLLPLYEAKMIHQFDHRWATYRFEAGTEEAIDVNPDDKRNPDYSVRPRYYVEECQVLARIANVPSAFAKAFAAKDENGLLLALANWIEASEVGDGTGKPQPCDKQIHLMSLGTEQLGLFSGKRDSITKRYSILIDNCSGVKLPKEWEDPKIILNASFCKLTTREMDLIQRSCDLEQVATSLMKDRSPNWLLGFRDITNAAAERTVIFCVLPQVGVGHTMPLLFTSGKEIEQALLIGSLNSMVLDFISRQKVGGTHLTFSFLRQFPILPPDRYTDADLDFIVPRVLELTYTNHDLCPWAEALGYTGESFVFDLDRRAVIRTELDAYYARLYGLTRDDLRYILDPADVMGPDYPSETFRVLKNNELKAHGEYRTQRLVLEAWDAQEAAFTRPTRTVSVAYPSTNADKILCSVALQAIKRTGGLSLTDLIHVLLFTTHPERASVIIDVATTDIQKSAASVFAAKDVAIEAQRLRGVLERRNAIIIERTINGQRVIPGPEIDDTLIWLKTDVGDWPDYAIKATISYETIANGTKTATAKQKDVFAAEGREFSIVAATWE
ncbi:MAG: hypothetical protein A2X46_14640 [Lentisphaerae bacterium GWF2_57_35]|nr:MAG: hypothetical protein A2X46_14640 [Lentisphaerae bacterium GWF2_57_35]